MFDGRMMDDGWATEHEQKRVLVFDAERKAERRGVSVVENSQLVGGRHAGGMRMTACE